MIDTHIHRVAQYQVYITTIALLIKTTTKLCNITLYKNKRELSLKPDTQQLSPLGHKDTITA